MLKCRPHLEGITITFYLGSMLFLGSNRLSRTLVGGGPPELLTHHQISTMRISVISTTANIIHHHDHPSALGSFNSVCPLRSAVAVLSVAVLSGSEADLVSTDGVGSTGSGHEGQGSSPLSPVVEVPILCDIFVKHNFLLIGYEDLTNSVVVKLCHGPPRHNICYT